MELVQDIKKMKLEIELNENIYIVDGSSWVRITKDEKVIAHVVNVESSFQVIYEDVHDCGGKCKILKLSDFKEIK